jgi:hypothetical protein
VGQFHRYRYANNNPYKFTDPDGRLATCNQNSCYIDCSSLITCTASHLYVRLVILSRQLENAILPIVQKSEPNESDSGENAGESGEGVVIPDKIADQLGERGWTPESIREVTSGEPAGEAVDNTGGKTGQLGEPASVYGSKEGGYVVVNDQTGEVVQVSDKNDAGWQPDPRIEWKDQQK